jgi:hypothetical protein
MRVRLSKIVSSTLLALSLLAASQSATAGCLKNYLKLVTERPDEIKLLQPNELPKKIYVTATEKDSEKAIQIALRAWDEKIDQDELRKFVHQIAEGDTSIITKKSFASLKYYRKFGGRMRDNYVLFDATHDSPEAFNRFVIDFGKLNDAIRAKKANRIVKMAQRVELAIDNLPDLEALSLFSPERRKGFQSFMKESLHELSASASQSEILVPAFHDARKSVRRLKSYFQISQILHPDPNNKIILQYLAGIDNRMGKIQDDFVKQSLKGKMDYNTTRVHFDNEFRGRILAFTNRVRLE